VIEVDPSLLPTMRQNSASVKIRVQCEADPTLVTAGVAHALRRLAAIRHPEEPDEPYASSMQSQGDTIIADMHDAEAYPGVLEAVISAVVGGLHEAGIDDAVVTNG
jgi:hypothetical protein